jgi:hypothetical protein
LSEISNFAADLRTGYALCGCEKLLSECTFWEDVNKSLREKLGFGIKDDPDQFNLRRIKHNLINRILFRIYRIAAVNLNLKSSHFRDRIDNIKCLYDTLFEHTDTRVLVDSSKSPKRAFLLKNNLKKYYRIKVIHLVRDGRAVLYSYSKGYYKVRLKNEDTGKYETKTYYADKTREKDEILKIWKRDNYQSFFYHNLFRKGKDYFFIRYEEFANHPEQILIPLLQFIGHPYEEEMLDLNRFENHMVSGNASRINALKILPPFENWYTELSEERLAYFQKKGRKLNTRLGYDSGN